MDLPKSIHFVGIGGIGMSAIAAILLDAGYTVSGSDLRLSPLTDKLEKQGAKIFQGHSAENVSEAELVVITSAARETNPEIVEAHRREIPVIKRAEMLGRLMKDKYGIAIAGTHGKTTTSSMISVILDQAGLSPTILVGGEIIGLESNAKTGKGQYLVAEADEYDGSFLKLAPRLAVITNIEGDHLDFYKNIEGVIFAFRSFAQQISKDGHLVACLDDENIRELLKSPCLPSVETYALNNDADWMAKNIRPNNFGGNDFDVYLSGQLFGQFELKVPGRHNVSNALAAIATASILGIDSGVIASSLNVFQGAHRRFEIKGEVKGITIVDDYGHHPTEIRATLRTARERFAGRNIVCVFQPHTFSRTKLLMKEFSTCFSDAHEVIIADIYPARETDDLGISSEDLVRALVHPNGRYGGDLDACLDYCLQNLKAGDVLMAVGAGDVDKIAGEVLRTLTASALSHD